jgi:hypothetical protein
MVCGMENLSSMTSLYIVFDEIFFTNEQRLTKRAPDKWESARFRSIFLASSFSTSQTLSTPAPAPVTQTVRRSLMTKVIREL